MKLISCHYLNPPIPHKNKKEVVPLSQEPSQRRDFRVVAVGGTWKEVSEDLGSSVDFIAN